MNPKTTVELEKPSAVDYAKIRHDCGFGKITLKQAETSLSTSLFMVSLYHLKELVGFGRIVGDGVLYFYIADVLVHPKMQGAGIGGHIMKQVLSYLEKNAMASSTIAVIAFGGKESFYQQHGFELCPNDIFGAGLIYPRLLHGKASPHGSF